MTLADRLAVRIGVLDPLEGDMHCPTYTQVKAATPLKPSQGGIAHIQALPHVNLAFNFQSPAYGGLQTFRPHPSIFNNLVAMHPVGPNEALAPRTEIDRRLLERLREQLTHNVNSYNNAQEEFKSNILYLIDTFKEACVELEAAQSELLDQAFQKGDLTCDILGPLKQYEITDGNTFMAPIGDMVVSYMPQSKLADDPPPRQPDIGRLEDSALAQHYELDTMEITSHTPDTPFTREASAVETETETESNPPESQPRKRIIIRTYSKRVPALVSTPEPVAPSLKTHRVSHFDTTGCKDTNVRLLAPDIELKWSKPLHLTSQPHIKRETVMKEKRGWVFSYTLLKRTALYIIRCPANCPSPVFVRHPLCQSRAVKHLRECQVPFDDEEDMVRRYAQQVVRDRKGRFVKLEWARKHNHDLFGELEEDVYQENFR